MASTLIQNNQAHSRVSLIVFTCARAVGRSVCAGITSISRDRLACDLAEVSRLTRKFEANLPSDVGAVQEV